MISSPLIDFCIGMFFFFFIMTMVCTMINEYFMDKFRKLRQKTLLEGIAGLFYDAQKVVDFYKHPLITALYRDDEADIKLPPKPADKPYNPGKDTLGDCTAPFKEILGKLPSYIPSRTFATALLDILGKDDEKQITQTVDNLLKNVNACDNARIKGALLPLINAAEKDVKKAHQNIEKWFDDTMDRVGGWFKRYARGWLLAIGFVACVVLNADTFMVGRILWQNPERLAALVKAAQIQADAGKSVPNPNEDLAKLRDKIIKETSQLPIGWVPWKAEKEDPRQSPVEIKRKEDGSLQGIKIHWDWGLGTIIFKLLGLISTALAISLGAPFWTDLINSFVNLRQGGKKPAPTAEERNK
jgi:hypothetical protein